MSHRILVIVGLMSNLVLPIAGRAQSNKELNSKTILLRGPEYEETCTKKDKAKSVSLGNKLVPIQVGDQFQVVTHRRGIANIKAIGKCQSPLYFEDGLYLFAARQYVDWERDTDALMAIKDGSLTSDQTGSVVQIQLNFSQRKATYDALKGHVPQSDTVVAETATILSPPNSSRLFLFVSTEHYNTHNYLTAGDQAIAPTGLLFEARGDQMSLLVVEDFLTHVYSISDIDNDGVWELLTYSGSFGGGAYEVRFFNGSRFLPQKIQLYEASH